MLQPDLYLLQVSKSLTKTSGWIPNSILPDLLAVSSFKKKLESNNFETFSKFDLSGLLNFQFEAQPTELSTLQNSVNRLAIFIDAIELIRSGYLLTSGPNTSEADYQLFLAKTYQDFKNKQVDKFTNLYSKLRELNNSSDDEIYNYTLSQLENLYTSSLAYENYPKLIASIKKYLENFSIFFKSQEDINEYHEIWLLYKAFLNLPGEVYSYIDDINLSGFLITPNEKAITEKIKELEVASMLIPTKEDLNEKFSEIKKYSSNQDSIGQNMKNLTKIYPSDLESIYNLTQIFHSTDDLFPGTEVELLHKGEEYNFNIKIFSESLALDDLAETIEFFDTKDINEQISDVLGNLIQFFEELPSLDISKDNYKILSAIVEDIIKAVKQTFFDQKINIFSRKTGLSIFDTIYFIDEDFPVLYEGLSGNFDLIKLEQSSEFNTSSIIELLSNYFKTKAGIIQKLKDSNYLNSLKTKRIEFYLKIINKEFTPVTKNSDHEGYIKQIIDYAKALNLKSSTELNYSNIDFTDTDSIANLFSLIGNEAVELILDFILQNKMEDQSFDKLQMLIGALGQLGVTPDFDFTNKKFTLIIDKQILADYLKGYYSYNALENKYNIRNLLSFGLMKGINVE